MAHPTAITPQPLPYPIGRETIFNRPGNTAHVHQVRESECTGNGLHAGKHQLSQVCKTRSLDKNRLYEYKQGYGLQMDGNLITPDKDNNLPDGPNDFHLW